VSPRRNPFRVASSANGTRVPRVAKGNPGLQLANAFSVRPNCTSTLKNQNRKRSHSGNLSSNQDASPSVRFQLSVLSHL
jgi:hypothetical protein